MKQTCPCGRPNAYETCCGLVHNNINLAQTAEDLMRSRYTAFTKANTTYLSLSHAKTTRPKGSQKDLERWAKSVNWLRLEVLNSADGDVNSSSGTVEFKAYFQEGSRVECIHENSLFIRENGHWVYLGEA